MIYTHGMYASADITVRSLPKMSLTVSFTAFFLSQSVLRCMSVWNTLN